VAVECVGDVGVEAGPAVCSSATADLERWLHIVRARLTDENSLLTEANSLLSDEKSRLTDEKA